VNCMRLCRYPNLLPFPRAGYPAAGCGAKAKPRNEAKRFGGQIDSYAQAVAERLEKSVHLRGDIFRQMIVREEEPMGAVLTADVRLAHIENKTEQ
jgi:hypothetical protein